MSAAYENPYQKDAANDLRFTQHEIYHQGYHSRDPEVGDLLTTLAHMQDWYLRTYGGDPKSCLATELADAIGNVGEGGR